MDKDMREAFEKAIHNDDGNAPPLHQESFEAGWQAALSQPRMSEEQAVIEMAEALCDEAERNGDIDEIPFVDAKILCRAAYRALLAKLPTQVDDDNH